MCLPANILPEEDTAFAKEKAEAARNTAAYAREESFKAKKAIEEMRASIADVHVQAALWKSTRAAFYGTQFITAEDLSTLVEAEDARDIWQSWIIRAENEIKEAELVTKEVDEAAVRAEAVAYSLEFFISLETPRAVIEKYLESVGW